MAAASISSSMVPMLSTDTMAEILPVAIVLNIENLYSIGTIEEEMEAAATCYRSLGQNAEIVNEAFEVVDEVHDCLTLFDRLNETLTDSWDLMYEQANNYNERKEQQKR